jgi:hypothetical protein
MFNNSNSHLGEGGNLVEIASGLMIWYFSVILKSFLFSLTDRKHRALFG